MKTILLATAACVATVGFLSAQTTNVPPGVIPAVTIRAAPVAPTPPEPPPVSLSRTNPVNLALDVSRVPERVILPVPGGARADFGLLKVFIPLDAKAGPPLTITTPDGRTLACRATFLALHDLASDQSLLLAEMTNRVGMIVGEREVVFTNCFDTLNASLRYRISADGTSLEQDLLLAEFGDRVPKEFAPENVRLEVWTEWFEAEPVAKLTQTIDLRGNDESGLLPPSLMENDGVDFGTARIVDGHAFSSSAQDEKTPVGKTWIRISNQDWLVETVDYLAVKSKLDLLPTGRRSAGLNRKSGRREELIRSLAKGTSPTPKHDARMLMAKAATSRQPEFVMDFVIVSSVPVPSGAVSWWSAGGNGNDALGTNHATLVNGAGYASGKVGQGFTLDGVNDRITALDSATLDFGAGADFSIEAWIKPETNTTDYGVNTVISKRYSPNTYDETR